MAGAVADIRNRASAGSRIGDKVVELGFASRSVVEDAVAAARKEHAPLGHLLVERQIITEDQLSEAVAARYGVPFVHLSAVEVDPAAVALVPSDTELRLRALPIKLEGERLLVAMANPGDILALDDIAMLTGCVIDRAGAPPSEIEALLTRIQRAQYTGEGGIVSGLASAQINLREAPDQAPTINLLNSVIAQAVEDRASDIHFDWDADELHVRYRIDGTALDVTSIPVRLAPGVISRIKIMAQLDIGEHRVPQDGRVSILLDDREIDVRVVTLPVIHGESAVLRILSRGNEVPALDDLGMAALERERFDRAIARPHGAILVTGPTGSGKTTTLYGALGILNRRDKTIVTVEDPVEYRLDGIKQMQVSARRGMTFPRALRSILRADPDIVLVGEIRDGETAQIAIEAALTGHLVLSTLHTNDAPGAMARLLEMGVEPFLVASSITGVVAQRLARVLCEHCKVQGADGWEPVGCSHCRGTGYSGRVGLFEVMPISPAISRLVLARRPAEEIAAQAVEEGMRTMLDDGMDKVRAGVTSLTELRRVTAS